MERDDVARRSNVFKHFLEGVLKIGFEAKGPPTPSGFGGTSKAGLNFQLFSTQLVEP